MPVYEPGFDLRQVEYIVYQTEQQVAVRHDDPLIFGYLLLLVRIGEEVREADDGVEGRAYLVADIGEESRFELVRAFGALLGFAQFVDHLFPRRDVAAEAGVEQHFARGVVFQERGSGDDAVLPPVVVGGLHPHRGFVGEVGAIVHHPEVVHDPGPVVGMDGAEVVFGGEPDAAVEVGHRVVVGREAADAVVVPPVHQP